MATDYAGLSNQLRTNAGTAAGTAATADLSKLPESYKDYYQTLYQQLTRDMGTVDYKPQSLGTLKSELQKVIRPSYDQQIQARKKATGSNRAAIDADAASRGLGKSTWVSDAKNRQLQSEATDLANINSNYNAALYSALMSQKAQQDQMSLSAQQAQLAARQAAIGQALTGAQYFYEKDTGGGGGGGGGGGRGGSGGDRPMPAPGDKSPDQISRELFPEAYKRSTEAVQTYQEQQKKREEALAKAKEQQKRATDPRLTRVM